jgi:hypothetical protein
VRFMPHYDRFAGVYLGGQHLCTAYPRWHQTSSSLDPRQTLRQPVTLTLRLPGQNSALNTSARTVGIPLPVRGFHGLVRAPS